MTPRYGILPGDMKSFSTLLDVLRSVRAGEVLLMLGFPTAAGLYGLTHIDADHVLRLATVVGALLPIAFSVYAYNAWTGLDSDSRDPKFATNPIHNGHVASYCLLWMTWIGLTIGVVVSAFVSWAMVSAVVVLWCCWVFYSHPKGLKGLPFAGTALHVVAGTLMFVLPYAMMRPLDERGWWLAAIIAVAFASGHCNHEILDRETDARAGFKTTAVTFGSDFVRRLGIALTLTAYGLVILAWLSQDLGTAEAVPFMLAAPLHLLGAWFTRSYATALEGALRYRIWYRIIFAVAVAVSLSAHLRSLMK